MTPTLESTVLYICEPAHPLIDTAILAQTGFDLQVAQFSALDELPDRAFDVALVVVDFTPQSLGFIQDFVNARQPNALWTPLIACCRTSADIEAALAMGVDDFLLAIDAATLRSRLRVMIQQKLHNDKLNGILNCTFDGIVSIDDAGAILSFNKAAQDMFGYQASDVVGRNVTVLMDATDAGQHDGHLRRYLTTGTEHIIGRGREVVGRTKSGQLFPLFLQVASLRSGSDRLFVGILKDLSVNALANALRHEVLHDPMTGIASRRRVLSVMPDWIARHSVTLARPFAIVFIDLDGFKAINDTYGHAAGDAILKAVGQRLQEGVGRADIAARLAGDEFVVLLDGIASQAAADEAAARLVEKIAEQVSYGDVSIAVQASAGAAVFPADGSTAEELLRRADTLMYTRKQGRKAAVPPARLNGSHA